MLVEVNCETDFVARNENFQALVKDIAMHIAGRRAATCAARTSPPSVLEKEKKIHREQLKEQGKPEAMLEKILAGKIEKYYKETVLLEQTFFKDPEGKRSVQDEINAAIAGSARTSSSGATRCTCSAKAWRRPRRTSPPRSPRPSARRRSDAARRSQRSPVRGSRMRSSVGRWSTSRAAH